MMPTATSYSSVGWGDGSPVRDFTRECGGVDGEGFGGGWCHVGGGGEREDDEVFGETHIQIHTYTHMAQR